MANFQVELNFEGLANKSPGRVRLGLSGLELIWENGTVTMGYREVSVRCCPRSLYIERGEEEHRLDLDFPLQAYERIEWQKTMLETFEKILF